MREQGVDAIYFSCSIVVAVCLLDKIIFHYGYVL